jgi:hypothetical protein
VEKISKGLEESAKGVLGNPLFVKNAERVLIPELQESVTAVGQVNV